MKKIVAIEDTISLRRKRKNGNKRFKPRVCMAKKKKGGKVSIYGKNRRKRSKVKKLTVV